jgi:Ribbon-helix-helix protein, copG family
MLLDPMAASATNPPRRRRPCAGIASGNTFGYTIGMKAAISLPHSLLKEAEAAAKELGVSRSKLVRLALEEFLKCRKASEITRRLNESYTKHPGEIDPFLQHLALEAMKRVDWVE